MSTWERRTVAALTLAFAMLLAANTVLVPAFRGPDEPQHVDLVRQFAEHGDYPFLDRQVAQPVTTALGLVRFHKRSKHLSADDAPSRSARPRFNEVAPEVPSELRNHIAEHPPLFYVATGTALAVLNAVEPGDRWSFDGQVALMRLISASFLIPVPLLAHASARRLGASAPVAVTAAVLPFAVPQLLHIGAVVNNDDLVIGLAAVLTWLVVRIMTGDDRRATALWAGGVAGAMLLTKGHGMVGPPMIALGYLVAVVAGRPWRTAALRLVQAAAVTVAAGGWWVMKNLIVEGSLQPHVPLHPDAPASFVPSFSKWWEEYAFRMPARFFGDFGWFDGARISTSVSAEALWIGVIGLFIACAVGLWSRRAAPIDDRTGGRMVVAALMGPVLALVLLVASRTYRSYRRNGLYAGMQGRYLFVGMVPTSVTVAMGWARIRPIVVALPALAVAGAVFMQVQGVRAILALYWAPEGASLRDQLAALAAWAPFGERVLLTGGIVMLGAVAVAVLGVWMVTYEATTGRVIGRVVPVGSSTADDDVAAQPMGS